MPPKGLKFTTWEQDKKDFIAYYGHLVPEEKHSTLIEMLSDLKECRMADLAERREDGELGPDEPRYFNNVRDLDQVIQDYAVYLSEGSGPFGSTLDEIFNEKADDFVSQGNLELLLLCYEKETIGDRKVRRHTVEPVSVAELRKLGIT